MIIVSYEDLWTGMRHISTQQALWWTDKTPLLLCESSHICEERSQLLPLTCLVLCFYSTGHYFINRDRTAITNVNWSPFLRIVWDPAAGCNLNKHKGNRAFDIRSTSAPGRGEGAPDPHVSPQKRKNYITDVQQEYSTFRASHCTSTPPPSLSLCARVAQQVAEIRLLSKDRFHCESTSTTLWITAPLFAAAAQQKMAWERDIQKWRAISGNQIWTWSECA